MTETFKSSLREARRNIYTTLHPREALPILTALLEAELEHDRHVSQLSEARHLEEQRQREIMPALRLLRAVVELAAQPAGVEEVRYQAAVAAADAALGVAEIRGRTPSSPGGAVTRPASLPFDYR